MKKLLVILLVLSSCSTNKKLISSLKNSNPNAYQVFKIDSIGQYYLIYSKKQLKDTIYKIISNKSINRKKNSEKIEIGNEYVFLLKSAIPNFSIEGKTIDIHTPYVRCYLFAASTEICLEDYVYDLYFATNVNGLYIQRQSNK